MLKRQGQAPVETRHLSPNLVFRSLTDGDQRNGLTLPNSTSLQVAGRGLPSMFHGRSSNVDPLTSGQKGKTPTALAEYRRQKGRIFLVSLFVYRWIVPRIYGSNEGTRWHVKRKPGEFHNFHVNEVYTWLSSQSAKKKWILVQFQERIYLKLHVLILKRYRWILRSLLSFFPRTVDACL